METEFISSTPNLYRRVSKTRQICAQAFRYLAQGTSAEAAAYIAPMDIAKEKLIASMQYPKEQAWQWTNPKFYREHWI
jgi:hypothetical protein